MTEKWDSDVPTTYCVLRRTRIGRSLRPELEKRVVKRTDVLEVDDQKLGLCSGLRRQEIACKMHASF